MPAVEMLARIKELEAENEWLKVEKEDLKDSCSYQVYGDMCKEREKLRKENAKLKCLALHGMFGYACAKMNVLAEKYEKEFTSGMVHKDFSRWNRLRRLWLEAYRKAKKELMEGK